MNREEFGKCLASGGIVPLTAREWENLSSQFLIEESHQTQLAGELLILRFEEGFFAVEAPSRDARVARLLGGAEEARAFVEKRLEEYERMWDGCGVKVDYYGNDR